MIGTQIGKYKITQRLGRGSMGTVYRAVDETLHRDVAIKVLNAELTDPEARRRFKAEAVAIARLNHPGIAKIFELFEHGDQWLMAIEFVQGETLEQLVSRSGPIPVDRAVDLVSQALDALDHALRYDSKDVELRLYRAQVLFALNRKPEARQEFQTVLQMQPGNKEAQKGLNLVAQYN